MHMSLLSPRIGAMISLAGVALIMPGFFLPMFTQSIPQAPESAHPLYEWQAVKIVGSSPGFAALFIFLAALPLLGMLIILATNVAALFRVRLPGLVLLNRSATGWGLGIQLLFNVLVLQILSIGYAHTVIAWGFVAVPIGFSISAMGAFCRKTS